MDKNEVLTLIFSIVGGLIGIIVPIIITFVVNRQLNKFTDKQDEKRKKELADRQELDERRKKEERDSLKQDMKDIVSDAVSPIIKDVGFLKEGTQAVLRNDLIQIADEWLPRGYCPLHIRQTFENTYVQYHNLGENGVMNGIRKQLLALPLIPPISTVKQTRKRKANPELSKVSGEKTTLLG